MEDTVSGNAKFSLKNVRQPFGIIQTKWEI